MRWRLVIAILAALCIVSPPTTFGQIPPVFTAGPVYPGPVVVGQTRAATFNITNNSFIGTVSINTSSTDHKTRYVPACRTAANVGQSFPTLMCQGAGDQDAGVFAVSATGTGTASPNVVGTAGCNGTTFTFTATGDAAGTIEISSAAPIVLPVGYTCSIAFTLTALAVPNNDASGAAGVQTLGIGNVDPVDGVALVANPSITGGGTGTTITTVFACPPGQVCCLDGYFAPFTTICRPSAGVCDVAESCMGTGVECPADVFQPSTTTCNADLCQSCLGDSGICPTENTCPSEACRTAGFWATHAGTEKQNSVDITFLVINSDGPVVICGQTLNCTDLDSIMSAEEALCVNVKGDSRLQLARQLTATVLNCLVNNHLGDCSNDPLFGTVFGLCNTAEVCRGSKEEQTACIDALDCLNSGGHVGIDANGNFFCGVGTCSDNQALCTPNNLSNCADPATATCNLSPNCHNEPLLGFEPPGPAGSSKKCNDANQTSCTILSCP